MQRDGWITQLPASMRPTAELMGLELDCLIELKGEAERALLAESRRHLASKILETAPGLGPIRTAQVIAIVVTPHRFRSKRQFWAYCGFGVVTSTSSDWVQTPDGWIRARAVPTRGLNRNHHPALKSIFKSAATTAIHRKKPDHPEVNVTLVAKSPIEAVHVELGEDVASRVALWNASSSWVRPSVQTPVGRSSIWESASRFFKSDRSRRRSMLS